MAVKSQCRRYLVAAMDFGTTYSGYAFSLTNEPMQVQINQTWVAGSRQLISLKTPTCILLNVHKEFHSFGFEAENKYADLASDDEHTNWYFFKHFKMFLHNTEGLKKDTEIEDVLGRRMPAMCIFVWSIKYLKDHLMELLQNRIPGIVLTDVHFVLTVPAIWDDKAKQYMRDAAVKAGISNDQLSIALEPEAAAIWCQQLESLKMSEPDSPSSERFFTPGMRYMAVDLGGGTVDIAVHEIKHDGSLGELYKASGGPWGGTCVDKSFLAFIGRIVGQDVLQTFARKHTSDYIDLLREFETKKRTIKSGMDTKITITLPRAIQDIFDAKGGDVKKAIAHSGNEGKVTWNRDKFRFVASIGLGFFDEPIQSTLNHVRMLLSDPSLSNVSNILLVGGFAECELVREAFKKHFRQKRIIIPEESGLVILKGATISGHVPRAITTRIARFTYGTPKWLPFDPAVHPNEKKRIYHINTEMATKIQGAGGKKTNGTTPDKTKSPLTDQEKKEPKKADVTQKIKNLEDDNKRLRLENITLKNNFDLREIIKALTKTGKTEVDGIEIAKDAVKMALKEAEEKHSAEIKEMEKALDEEKMKRANYITEMESGDRRYSQETDKEIAKYRAQNKELEREVGSLKAEKNELNKNIKILKMETESLKKKLEETEVLLRQKESEITHIHQDVTHFQTRLSEVAGAKLTDELFPKTDLSDPNRPTKLGEKYLELYDYQWTDAFANLSKKYPSASDETLSAYLYDILIDGYRFCQGVRQAQNRSLEEIVLHPAGGEESSKRSRNEEIPEIFFKYLSEAAKVSSNVTRVNVVKAFVTKETTKKKYGEIMKLCALYIEECVQLCWQMQLHIPPVCIDLTTVRMDSFVADIYKEYTRRGKKIAFVVWPALLLHENGPLLVKGVAQGE